jgi:hypothetical protein
MRVSAVRAAYGPRRGCPAGRSRVSAPAARNQGGQIVGYLWEILRYFAAWGGTGLIIWFWYWLFSNIGTF